MYESCLAHVVRAEHTDAVLGRQLLLLAALPAGLVLLNAPSNAET